MTLTEKIDEELSKFPSKDVKEIISEETGLTIEEVEAKMNEAAAANATGFPAPDFAVIAGTIDNGEGGEKEPEPPVDPQAAGRAKVRAIVSSHSSDFNISYDNENDEYSAEEIDKETENIIDGLDRQEDGQVTFKIAYLTKENATDRTYEKITNEQTGEEENGEETTDWNDYSLSPWYSLYGDGLNGITESVTVPLGTTLAEYKNQHLPNINYDNIFIYGEDFGSADSECGYRIAGKGTYISDFTEYDSKEYFLGDDTIILIRDLGDPEAN